MKHQRNLKEKRRVAEVSDFVPRGQKMGPAATVFRKGACTNCGAMTHAAKVRPPSARARASGMCVTLAVGPRQDCVERPRKKGAKYTGEDIRSDELVVELAHDYASKRDHWAQYEAANHMEMIKARAAAAARPPPRPPRPSPRSPRARPAAAAPAPAPTAKDDAEAFTHAGAEPRLRDHDGQVIVAPAAGQALEQPPHF